MRPMPPWKWIEGVDATSPAGRASCPTRRGMAVAAATLGLLTVGSVLLLVPAVFFLIPIPSDVDAVTLCVPGMGPLQRFSDGLEGEHEEMVHVHENVHAEQCRTFGPLWYARHAITPSGRLALEAPALCAEVAMLSARGADRTRLKDRTVEALSSGYIERGRVPRWQISAAVDRACGVDSGD